ncbi:MAG: thiamine-phosphate pyrophosphorylase [Planctomycetota bacterium]|jgi:thiamine-phosphate pyrophosphorylase
MLLFTPELCTGTNQPLDVLMDLAAEVDIVQVRIKPSAEEPRLPGSPGPPAEGRASYDWTLRILEAFAPLSHAPMVLVDDRVDVALALQAAGCAGVHLGRHDFPVDVAREQLGAEALIGLSTHDVGQVVRASDSAADYIGFGPIFATKTKGYAAGVAPETAWIADSGSSLPLFPIGGINLSNVQQLARVGRAAVSSALLSSKTPAQDARALREMLED